MMTVRSEARRFGPLGVEAYYTECPCRINCKSGQNRRTGTETERTSGKFSDFFSAIRRISEISEIRFYQISDSISVSMQSASALVPGIDIGKMTEVIEFLRSA